MSPKCKVCIDPRRAHINRMLMNPKNTMRFLAAKYSISQTSLRRHREHIKEAIRLANEKGVVKDGKSGAERLMDMMDNVMANYTEAKGMEKVAWSREVRGWLEVAFKLGYEEGRQEQQQKFNDVTQAIKELIDSQFTPEAMAARATDVEVVD